MTNEALYWVTLLLAFIAGGGVVSFAQLMRQPHPGRHGPRAEDVEAAGAAFVAALKAGAGEQDQEPPAPPGRTARHGYDTAEVAMSAYSAGQRDALGYPYPAAPPAADPYGMAAGNGEATNAAGGVWTQR